MDPVVLLKIESLHARTSQKNGMEISQQGKKIDTGPIFAHLDPSALSPDNMGMIDLATGAIQLRWAIIATLPFLADAFAQGAMPQKDSSPVRASLEETGQVLEDGSGFKVTGTGQIGPGSMLSSGKIAEHNNFVQIHGGGRKVTLGGALAAGKPVRCVLVPDSCFLDLVLPDSFGGGTQHLNLVGGFILVPVMTLARPERTKRTRK